MEYLSLYRKWRPKRFDEGYVGQEHIVRTLKNALAMNKIGHAYLFNGPRGTGKTTAAKILAKAVNCTGRGDDPNPCNNCPSCERINSGVSLDVLEIDGASNRGIDEVRELREKVKFAPVEGKYKVYIIDEVHMLTTEAFNALLKTLEEPPPHVIFIFATTESHKLPATIRSRCQCFDFKRLTHEEITSHLSYLAKEEGFNVEEEAIRLIAREAGGGVRDAIGIFEQSVSHSDGTVTAGDVQAILGLVDTEELFDLARAVAEKDVSLGLEVLNKVVAAGKDLVFFARQAAGFFRDLLVILLTGDNPPVTLDREVVSDAKKLAARIGPAYLKKGINLFMEAGIVVKRGVEGTLPLELALIRLITEEVDSGSKIEDIERRIKVLEEKSARAGQVNPGHSPAPEERSEKALGKKTVAPSKPEGDGLEKTKPSEADEKGISEQKDVKVDWEELLAVVRRRKRTVEALLREGKPGGYRSGSFIIEFSPEYRFHWENINKPVNTRLVEEALSEVTGKEISLRCVLLEENRAEEEEKPEMLRKALDIFGGQVIDKKED